MWCYSMGGELYDCAFLLPLALPPDLPPVIFAVGDRWTKEMRRTGDLEDVGEERRMVMVRIGCRNEMGSARERSTFITTRCG